MPTITKREAQLDSNIKFRNQNHGDELVQAGDIPVSGIKLGEEDLNAMLQEPHAWRGLFVKGSRGKPDSPLLKNIDPLKLKTKLTDARVSIFTGVNGGGEIKLGVCSLKNVRLTPEHGGLTDMSCLIQSTPTLDKRIAELVEHMGSTIHVAIEYDHEPEQVEADLGEGKSDAADPGAKGRGSASNQADLGDGFAAAAKAQVDGWRRGRKGSVDDDDSDAATETH